MGNPVPKPQFKPKAKKNKKSKRSPAAKRNDFPPGVRRRKKVDSQGVCELCNNARIEELHHVKRRNPGRGVYSNAIYLCWHCHNEIVHKDRHVEDGLRDKYEFNHGRYYYMDKKDIETLWRFRKEIDFESIKLWEKVNRQKVDL